MTTLAQKLLAGDRSAAALLASGLLKPRRDNFVERPWGGLAIREYKRLLPLPDQLEVSGHGLGEAFEICADADDREAREHPSRITLEDGSWIALDTLLERHGRVILGEEFARRYGPGFPLLPKTLDVKELLSVQGHPRGHTEAYVILGAEPGATLRLGFNEDVDARALSGTLRAGSELQRELLAWLPAGADPLALQRALAPWLAARDSDAAGLAAVLGRLVDRGDGQWGGIVRLAVDLKARYWQMLDVMNVLPLEVGQVIHNSTPARLLAPGAEPAAEMHALGNPERCEALMLEIRRPGPTLRAWDHARFPIREIDIEGALAAVNLRRTEPAEFLPEPEPIAAGTWCCIDSRYFRIERLRPGLGGAVDVAAAKPHCLHATAGAARVERADRAPLGVLLRGESAIVAARVGAYRVIADTPDAELFKVSLPGSP